MSEFYPLQFEPLFRRYIWGGDRLKNLGKSIGDQSCAESWEIVDHGPDQSVVKYGAFSGQSLSDLVTQFPVEMLGESVAHQIASHDRPEQLRNRFPLLLKFLDANRNLSVQVHPDDAMGSQLTPPDLGKTEAWFVIDAEPGAKVYAGLKEGVDQTAFANAVEQGETELVIHAFDAKKGDCIFIPAGTVHAIGAGLLIAEIQQSSDTTFRLFDWNRVGNDGKPRELHIEQGIEAIDFSKGPVHPIQATEFDQSVLQNSVFSLSIQKISGSAQLLGNQSCRIVAVIDGSVSLGGDASEPEMVLGSTALVPACCKDVEVTGEGTLLVASPTT